MVRPNHPIDSPPYILPSPLPQLTRRFKPAPIPETPLKTSIKRPLPMEIEDGVLDLDPTPKKLRMDKQLKRKFAEGHSPSKRRRLEEDGLVEMDGPNEVLEDPGTEATREPDVIVIDED